MNRKICHECGTEVTHRPQYKIFAHGEILTVCPVCHARYVRERAKEKERLLTAISKRPNKNKPKLSVTKNRRFVYRGGDEFEPYDASD